MHPKNNGYAAGIIDGEGCISIYISKRFDKRQGKYVYRPVLEISAYQGDKRLTDWLQFHYGGAQYEHTMKNSSRPGYQWTAPRGKTRELFILEILPYLILKHEQALLALEYLRLPRTWDMNIKRFDLAQKCSKFNRKASSRSQVRAKYEEAMISVGASPETDTSNIGQLAVKIQSELRSDAQSATAEMPIA
jgi:hypothetical protein